MCSIEGCGGIVVGRGLCNKHWFKWRRHGNPLGGKDRYFNPEDRFSSSTEWHDGCLVWTGAKDNKGYGHIKVDGRLMKAHRYAWEKENGPISEGMEIDHICRNRSCVNVKHLRLATRSQNMQNISPLGRGKSGVRGVHRDKDRWRACLRSGKTVLWQEWFTDLDEAKMAIFAARRKFHSHAPLEVSQ